MLNKNEHEILNVHKNQNIKKFSIFQAQISLECFFFLLVKVEMPTFYNSCSAELSMKKVL